jgi:hypothetical protein
MKQILENAKTIIAELIGIIGGLIWAYKTNWDYEPLILLIASLTGFIISVIILLNKKESTNNLNVTNLSLQIHNNQDNIEKQRIKENMMSSETNHALSKENSFYTDISPTTIKNKISSSPLFQQVEVANNFIGLNVQWILKLFLIHKRAGNEITVVMTTTESLFPHISFTTNTEDYPIFKIAEDEKPFIVTGKIIECERASITLKLTSLEEA